MTTNTSAPNILHEFDWLTNEIAREQEYFWTRFSAFATLHAGLLVLVTSNGVTHPWVLSVVAIVLGGVWLYIQWASLFYVNRFKPRFHAVREALGYEHVSHQIFSGPARSSVHAALWVPAGITLLWMIFPFLR